MTNTSGNGIFSELWRRRLPQFFATYIGICWGILQFLNFICNRYSGLSDSLIDKFLIFVAVLIPGVLIFIYNHGQPGADKWTKFEKVFIPSNLAIAMVLAIMLGSSTVDAAPTKVNITTEEGEQVTRMVPSQSQTRQIAIFPFDIENENEQWAQLGAPQLLSLDLEQDMRVFTRTSNSLDYFIKSYDYKVTDKIPFSTKLKIANKTKVDYFTIGNLRKDEDAWALDIKIYEAGSGELFIEKTFTNSDFFMMIDDCTKAISSSMFLKESTGQLDKIVDLPASDLITPDLEALALFIKGKEAIYYSEQYEAGAKLLSQASTLDTKSAEIYATQAISVSTLGDRTKALELISKALNLSKQLPERQQLKIKETYWAMNDQGSKALLLKENWIKLYPQDYEPYKSLLNFYKGSYQLKKAKDIAQLAIDNGHKLRALAEMVDLSILLEDFDDAEIFLNEYHKEYPELAAEDLRLADIYLKKGAFDKAISFYDGKLLEDPQNSNIHVKLAETYALEGKYKKADASFEQALRYAKQGPDSSFVYNKKMVYLTGLGQTSKVIALMDEWQSCLRTYLPEIAVGQSTMQLCPFAAIAGADGHVRSYFDKFYLEFPQYKPAFDCVTNFLFSLFKNDPEELKKYNQGQCKAMVYQGSPDLEYFVNGLLASMEKKHEEALGHYNTYIEKSGANGKDFGYMIAKEHRLMNNPKEAIKQCKAFLKTSPYNGQYLLELSLAELAGNDKPAAIETYKKLQETWKNAEPEFTLYNQYQQLGKDLGIE